VIVLRTPGLAIVLLLFSGFHVANGQGSVRRETPVEVEAEELPSAYGAPPDLSRGRISTLTKSYVLSPFSFELETGYEGDLFRHGLPAHLFTQEIEMGLPARFTVGAHNLVERFDDNTRDAQFTLEGRYALANWNRLPFNPAVSAEYHFGIGHGAEDSGELALLMSHSFSHLVEWALNVFVEHGFGGAQSTEGGFAQSVEIPVLLPEEKLEAGIEMQYHPGDPASLHRSRKGFTIGPTLAWRPTKAARFDVSPLIGCSHDAPAVQIFAIFSLSFGSGPETEIPASARGR